MTRGWSEARIRKELARHDLTLAAIARRARVSRTTVARSLATGGNPRVAATLGRALRVKPSTIWPGAGRTSGGRRLRADAAATGVAFEGATVGKRLGMWGLSALGPNAAVWSSLQNLRMRSREAYRNNPWVRRGIESKVANLVGTGIVPRWNLPGKPELKAEIEARWLRWTDESDADGAQDFYGQQACVARTWGISGEALARFRPRRLDDRPNGSGTPLAVPLQIQLLEPDHIDDTRDQQVLEGGHVVRMGIEYDAIGRKAAYHLRRQHPGDAYPMSGTGGFETVAVPAEDIMHVFDVQRPGQIRGVPWLATVLLRLHMFDLYEDAELVRKNSAAFFGGAIIDPTGIAGNAAGFGVGKGNDAAGQQMIAIEPGTWPILRPGQDIKFFAPADVGGNYDPWTRMQLRAIAAGLDAVTYEMLTGDGSQLTFSSIRAMIIEVRRRLEMLIHQVLVFQFCRRVVERWMDTAVAAGVFRIPDYFENRAAYLAIEWSPQRWEYVQPVDDILAERMQVRGGIKSRQAVIRERGDDPATVEREIDEENRRADERGFVFDTDARKTSQSGSLQDDELVAEAVRGNRSGERDGNSSSLRNGTGAGRDQ